jgi:hypothetical protein
MATRSIILSVLILACASGCAGLKIKVSQYSGDLTLDRATQLDVAVGEARYVRSVAGQYLAKVNPSGSLATINPAPRNPPDSSMSSLEYLTGYYDNSVLHSQALVSRAHIAGALLKFGQEAISTGRLMGVPELADWRLPYEYFFTTQSLKDRLAASVALEEGGRKILLLTDNATDTSTIDDQTRTAHLLQAAAPGVVADLLGGGVFNFDSVGKEIFDAQNWKPINTIKVDAVGDTQYVVAKDELGNWHIKSVTSDPSDVVNAIADGATLALKVAAAAEGIPTGTLGGASTSTSTSSQTGTDTSQSAAAQPAPDDATTAATQQQISELSQTNFSFAAKLKAALADASADPTTANATHDQILTIVKDYQSDLASIKPIATTKPSGEVQSNTQ